MKKAKRLGRKKFRRLTENKRKNAESEESDRESWSTKSFRGYIKRFSKGMLIISIEGKEERAPLFDKKKITKKNIEDER